MTAWLGAAVSAEMEPRYLGLVVVGLALVAWNTIEAIRDMFLGQRLSRSLHVLARYEVAVGVVLVAAHMLHLHRVLFVAARNTGLLVYVALFLVAVLMTVMRVHIRRIAD